MSTNRSVSSDRTDLRRKILDAAMFAFQEHGIKAVTMSDIASQLSISKRTLYEIYANKEDLLFECVCDHDKQMKMQLQEVNGKNGNAMDILIHFIKINIENSSKTNPLFFSDLRKYPKVMAYINSRNENSRENSIGFMKRGVEEGFFRDDVNYDLVNLMAEVFMKHVMDTKLYKIYPLSEIISNVILFMLRGFCTEKGLERLQHLTT
jgi:hypothetical protein